MMSDTDLRARFLEPETRDGHYVSAETKKIWKCELDILEEILRICKKHNLQIFMAGGSLIGAVRHKGFVPWDDDIDVDMPRADYNRFLEVAQSELPSHYFLRTQLTDSGFLEVMAKVCDRRTSAIRVDYTKDLIVSHMGIFVDIFPLDALPKCVDETKKRFRMVRFLAMIRRRSVVRRLRCWRDFAKLLLAKSLTALVGRKRLFKMQETLYTGLPEEDGELVAECPGAWHDEKLWRWILPKNALKDTLWVEFEYLKVPIPAGYDAILTRQYGDWKTPVKGGALHDGLVKFDTSRSFKEVLVEQYGYKMTDFPKEW